MQPVSRPCGRDAESNGRKLPGFGPDAVIGGFSLWDTPGRSGGCLLMGGGLAQTGDDSRNNSCRFSTCRFGIADRSLVPPSAVSTLSKLSCLSRLLVWRFRIRGFFYAALSTPSAPSRIPGSRFPRQEHRLACTPRRIGSVRQNARS
jgi:hypothetical protein